MLFILSHLDSVLIEPNKNPGEAYKVSDLFKGFRVDTLVSGAIFCAICLEFSIGDWAAIFTKEDMGINSGLHTLPYILFTLAMITGRLFVHKLFKKFAMQSLMTSGALLSGVSFLCGLATVHLLGNTNKILV
jgi:hypothetical protein